RQGLSRAPARITAGQQTHVQRAEYLVLGRAFLQAATGRRIPRSREPGGTNRRLRSPYRGIARRGIARPRRRPIRSARLSQHETRTPFERLGRSPGRSQFEQAAEPSGLGFYMGKARLPRERRALPSAGHCPRRTNQWQFERAGYDTHDSYASFVVLRLGIALLSALGTALMVTLVLPGGEPLYRSYQPNRMQLSKAFTMRGLRSREFFSSAVVGLALAAGHIGFIVAFYLVGSRFGVWAPQDLNYSDAVNTTFPWIAGVAIGLMASTSEEFLFRLFAIPFVERVTKSRVLAVILPAFSWSFLHSAYPQEPGYIRGIEVGIIGVVAGMVMLRWGILATLIWHYTVDASLVGMLLIRSNSLYFKISGVVVGAAALAPLALACISYLTRGGFETAEDLLNRAAPAPEIDLTSEPAAATSEVQSSGYDALSPGM